MKPVKQPTSYRSIKITSLVKKVVECHNLAPTRPILHRQNIRIFGFTKDLAPIFAAVLVTVMMAQAVDTYPPLSITFLETFCTAKAFDVSHKCILNALQ